MRLKDILILKDEELKPDTWCKLLDTIVMDPDGWDRKNFYVDWEKKLTLKEFIIKSSASTCRYSKLWMGVLKKIK
jgi:hypothetical protein